MKVREYIEKIGDNKNVEDMEKLGDMLAEIIYKTKECHPDIYEEYKMRLYTMAYGKVLTRDMAEHWVESMQPKGKWDFDTTTAVRNQYNIKDISEIAFYVVMNMLYSDMSNVLGDGETQESIDKYVQATKDWLDDADVTGNGEEKLYNYYFYVVK